VQVIAPTSIAELTRLVRSSIADGRILDAVALMSLADVLVTTEDERLAFARLRAVTMSRSGDHPGAVSALSGIAAAWLSRSRLMEAADINALEAFLNNMAGSFDVAIDHAATALVLIDESTEPDPALTANVLNSLGLVFRDLEAHDLAIRQFQQAEELLASTAGDGMLLGVVRANLTAVQVRKAIGLLRTNRAPAEAGRLLARSEERARLLLANETSPRRRVEAATMLASVLMHAGRVAEAYDELIRHADEGDCIDDVRALGDWNLMWGWVLREQGGLTAALARVNRAIELFDQASDPISRSLAVRERSRIHELSGDTSAALCDLRSADDEARSLRAHRVEVLVEQIARRAQLEASRRRLQRETEQLGMERRRLTEAVRTDPLTGVGNRRRLMVTLGELRDGPLRPVSILMVDVDSFKTVNDSIGHEHGDAVLIWLADVLVDAARAAEMVCRMGGDEFVVILPGLDEEEALEVAESVRHRAAERVWATRPGRDLAVVTVSIGVASGTTNGVIGLTADADEALLQAKRLGRDRVEVARVSG
jgi:diguanylate cyclase (GGDEF)-like protein